MSVENDVARELARATRVCRKHERDDEPDAAPPLGYKTYTKRLQRLCPDAELRFKIRKCVVVFADVFDLFHECFVVGLVQLCVHVRTWDDANTFAAAFKDKKVQGAAFRSMITLFNNVDSTSSSTTTEPSSSAESATTSSSTTSSTTESAPSSSSTPSLC